MKTADIESVANRQSHKCCVGIPMDISNMMNTRTTQRRIFYASIIMDIFTILYVVTTQRHRGHADIPMNVFAILYVVTTQRCKRCTFDSPGLASDSEGYPGAFVVSGNNAVGVVPFISRHFITAFHVEKVQHLRR